MVMPEGRIKVNIKAGCSSLCIPSSRRAIKRIVVTVMGSEYSPQKLASID